VHFAYIAEVNIERSNSERTNNHSLGKIRGKDKENYNAARQSASRVVMRLQILLHSKKWLAAPWIEKHGSGG
jgi:hypothetical protein